MGTSADVVVVTCGDASWPGGGQSGRLSPRPGREELDPVLSTLDGRRLVVCGTDADLAAVVLRVLRTGSLADVALAYVPSSSTSAVAALWGLPVLRAEAAAVALRAEVDPVPLVRDDAGGVLVGLGVVRPVRGVAYCDNEVVLRGQAARIEVTPDPEHGLVVRVVRRGLLGRRIRAAAGRAVQLGCLPTTVVRDGIATATPDRWTWYRHTEDLRLVRGLL